MHHSLPPKRLQTLFIPCAWVDGLLPFPVRFHRNLKGFSCKALFNFQGAVHCPLSDSFTIISQSVRFVKSFFRFLEKIFFPSLLSCDLFASSVRRLVYNTTCQWYCQGVAHPNPLLHFVVFLVNLPLRLPKHPKQP